MSAAKSLAVVAPVIPSLFAAAQRLRAVPTDYSALMERDRLLDVAEKGRRGTVVAGRDGLQANPAQLEYLGGYGSPLREVLSSLDLYLAAEDCRDVLTDWTGLRFDRRDGYLYREALAGAPVGGPGAGITEHAAGQLASVLKTGGTGAGITSATFGAVSPAIRELLLLELQATTKRERTDFLVVRSGMRTITEPDTAPRMGAQASFVTRTERVARAVVTPRHSGTAFDDVNIAAVLREVASLDARAAFLRAELGTESRGWVEVSGGRESRRSYGQLSLDSAKENGLDLMVNFRNSETGQARLSFRGSCRITALDAVVVQHRGVSVNTTEEISISSATGASERNHTLPTVFTRELGQRHPTMPSAKFGARPGDKLSTDDRRVIAADRMKESFSMAADGALQLAAAWAIALTQFVDGFNPDAFKGLDAAAQAEVLLDMCEERGFTLGQDRAALAKVLTDDKRLTKLPHGSAAHIAGCYALLAARGETKTVDGKSVTVRPLWQEAERLQQAAGRWVACGWDLKAHRTARGEQD